MENQDDSSAGKKIFIVEDDTFLGKILQQKIEHEKMNVSLFISGEEFMEMLKKTLPDVVLLDIFLPGINGMDLLEMLRKDPRTANLPITIISNSDDIGHREHAKKLDAGFLIKALTTPEAIVASIKEMLSKKN